MVENANFPMSKKDEWLDSRLAVVSPGKKAAVSL
jgi:hypothetical protein